MPIANYKNPGVYVSQVNVPSVSLVNSEALNTCFIGYTTNVPSGQYTDRFVLTSTSGVQTGYTFSYTPQPSGNLYVYNNVTGSGLVQGTDYILVTSGSTITGLTITSGGGTNLGYGNQVQVQYWYNTFTPNTLYTFYDLSVVQQVFGPAFDNNSATPSVFSPITLAASLAFANGAQIVSAIGISSGAESDFLAAITSASGVNSRPDIDVIVPLCGVTSTGPLATGLRNYLAIKATNGIYQRSFVSVDSSVTNSTLTSTVGGLVPVLNSTRITLTAPQTVLLNAGGSSVTGQANNYVTASGYYISAALAGLFAGQTDVYVPITQKTVYGLAGIPNQISPNDSTTVQGLGGTIVRQRADGTIYVRHGLTTNLSNWLTQEISVNAIGDRLANNLQDSLVNANVIGSPIIPNTIANVNSVVLGTLTRAVQNNLIQSFQGLNLTLPPSNPTAINISFQYSPTFPLNYINVTMSVNTQSGNINVSSSN